MQEFDLIRPDLVETIRENIVKIEERITNAATQVGRDPREVKLVVVTKAQPAEVTQAAIRAGARILGENYPEQAVPKIEALAGETNIEWHMIGHLQSRKARLVAEHFHFLQSLDSLKLAQKMDAILAETGKELPVLLEFNLGGEESKHGWDATQETTWETLFPEIEDVLALPHLRVCGCMTMPPFADEAEDSRVYFKQLHKLRDLLARRFTAIEWRELSMGTSGDFDVAVQEGATYVRVGQAILGPRPKTLG
ncbi:MAG TPA: YggS family pyridoxal phosphate-dependent enzyme [Anaerolineaceae bacterium]|nr:YggS family pyridoxal phosphate-dependent enzyme [Anaerolineaceae bacterium]